MIPPKAPGVYMLTHIPTGLYYVGSSGNLTNRYYGHKTALQNRRHKNPRLNDAFTHWDDIEYTFELCRDREHAFDREQELLDDLVGQRYCCNLAADSRAVWGNGMPTSVRDKIVAFNTGRDYGQSFKDMRSRMMMGIPRTDEQKRKLSISLSGRTRDPAIGVKISAARKGWVPSDETRFRMSEAKKGKPGNPIQLARMKEATSIPIIIEGVRYTSAAEASRCLGIPQMTIRQRVGSHTDRFKDWTLA